MSITSTFISNYYGHFEKLLRPIELCNLVLNYVILQLLENVTVSYL